ncbi:MAG: response regulator transcription factor [Rhizobiales bacterium]|nr:response regulator transcription factor [Hyphomicrobiales bacterium]
MRPESPEREIFILDDEADVREALRTILQSGGYKPVCFADDVGLLETVRRRCPVAILLDVNLPGRSGLEILKDLADCPAPVVIISGRGDIPTAVTAIKEGAQDFIQKPFRGGELLGLLEKLLAASSTRCHEALGKKISSVNFPGREPLTRRERDVLRQVVIGASNKEIATALGISFRTVEEHRSNIMRKLGVKNAAELIIAVLK